ncbi:hypothetical protein [Clostridium tertium]|uniref:hypothetical protein n=1 Tax=Clostridium tertium TaxID=1559 RepID=UPI001C1E62F5|nr:hypothetical protein [Clostridium tertium]MBU6134780.1 hypothetical protein [Clostridium tertium]
MKLVIKEINNKNYNEALRLKVKKGQEDFIETNDLAIKMYEKIGFQFNGELDINGEKIMKLEV